MICAVLRYFDNAFDGLVVAFYSREEAEEYANDLNQARGHSRQAEYLIEEVEIEGSLDLELL